MFGVWSCTTTAHNQKVLSAQRAASKPSINAIHFVFTSFASILMDQSMKEQEFAGAYTAEPALEASSAGCMKTVLAPSDTEMPCAAMCDRNSGGSCPTLEMLTWKVCTSPTFCHCHTSAGPPATLYKVNHERRIFTHGNFVRGDGMHPFTPSGTDYEALYQQHYSMAAFQACMQQLPPSAFDACTAAVGCVPVITSFATSAASMRSSTL